MPSTETSRTRVISVRVPKDLLNAVDAIVEAGFFKNRTEFTTAAYVFLLDHFVNTLGAYLATKEKLGPPTPENLPEFVKAYLRILDKVLERKMPPVEESAPIVLLNGFLSLETRNPEKLGELVQKLGITIVKKNEMQDIQDDPSMAPDADRPETPEDHSNGGDSTEVILNEE